MRRPAPARFVAASATFLLLNIIFSPLSPAQIPRTLSYQGILSDTAGVPKPDGVYGITFRIYPVSVGGSPLWTEAQIVSTRRGLFSAVLGEISLFPDSLRFDKKYWLSVQVSPDPELNPRIQLTAVGYSLRSWIADTAQYARNAPGALAVDSARVAGTVPNNSITALKIAAGQVVKSLNGVHDVITLRGQGAASITSNGDTITITTPPPSGGTGVQSLQNTNNTLTILNPTGPTVTANVKVPLALNGNVPLGATFSSVNGAPGGIGISSLSDSTHGIYSVTNSTAFGASGVLGVANASLGFVVGTYGLANNSPFGTGVTGWGSLQGVYGTSTSGGNGVVGQSPSSGIGVYGSSATGVGVRGDATQAASGAYGVYGTSPGLVGVLGEITGTSGQGIGVLGKSGGENGIGVRGFASSDLGQSYGVVGMTASHFGNSAGVRGEATSSTGSTIGVEGVSVSNAGTGVWGHNDVSSGVGVSGTSVGGTGISGTSTNGTGSSGSSTNGTGVAGSSANGIAVLGTSTGSDGIRGSSTSGTGVRGTTNSADAYAVFGSNTATASSGGIGLQLVSNGLLHPTGVFGASGGGANGIAIWARANSSGQFSNQLAGFFEGNVRVTGDFSVGGSKNFMIDHPLDPENKYLVHACVESDERINIYVGNITTDGSGDANVDLPSYFTSLNRDYRYQLTVIGQFAQAIVSEKILNNRFSIKTDKPFVEVSWQVAGIRNDTYARAHPMQVEVEKPGREKGTYIYPELYGLPPRMLNLSTGLRNQPGSKEKE